MLAGGILLSLAANLAQAQPTAWGRIVAAVPPAAFLVAVSMIERRAARRPRLIAGADGSVGEPSAPGRPSPVPDAGDEAQDGEDEALLAAARRAAAEHQDQHGQPITRDALRARLGVSNQAASELLRQLRAGEGQPPGSLPRRLTLAASPRRQRPWSAEGRPTAGAVCPRGSTARQARRGAGGGSTGTAKAWQPTGTGSPATGRPAASAPLPGLRTACGRRGGRRPGARDSGPGRSAELADRLA